MQFIYGRGSGEEQDSPEQMRRMMSRHSPLENEVPGGLAFSAVLARTEVLAVAITGGRVFSTGLEFSLALRLRRVAPGDEGLYDFHHHMRRPADGTGLLLGVVFPDGRTATNLGWSFGLRPPEPDVPTLTQGGGGGGDTHRDMTYWLSPLPPAGDLTVVFAWPHRGIPETRTVIPGPLLAAAAAQSVELWPWEPPLDRPEPAEPAPLDLPPGWFSDILRDQQAP